MEFKLDFDSPENIFKLEKVGAKAKELMKNHRLEDWTFKWDNAKFRAGCCDLYAKQISLSKPLALLRPFEKTVDAILHEIAHALTPGQNHNKIWKAKAKEIGCSAERTFSLTPDEKKLFRSFRRQRTVKYIFQCPHCKTLHKRFTALLELRRLYICAVCAKKKDVDRKNVIILWQKVDIDSQS